MNCTKAHGGCQWAAKKHMARVNELHKSTWLGVNELYKTHGGGSMNCKKAHGGGQWTAKKHMAGVNELHKTTWRESMNCTKAHGGGSMNSTKAHGRGQWTAHSQKAGSMNYTKAHGGGQWTTQKHMAGFNELHKSTWPGSKNCTKAHGGGQWAAQKHMAGVNKLHKSTCRGSMNCTLVQCTTSFLESNITAIVYLDIAIVDQLSDHGHAGSEDCTSPLEHYRSSQRTPAVWRSRVWSKKKHWNFNFIIVKEAQVGTANFYYLSPLNTTYSPLIF